MLAGRHALLLVDMDCNCMRIGSKVCICTAPSLCTKKENSFHKLIHMIKIFMRNFLWFSTIHDIFNIELFPNYASHRIKAKFEYESFTDTKITLKPANLSPAHQNYFIYSSIITLLSFKCISLKLKISFVKNLPYLSV